MEIVRDADGEDLLCVLHDVKPHLAARTGEESSTTLKMAYRWNGFGFSAARAAKEKSRCR